MVMLRGLDTFLSYPAGNGKGRQSRPYKSFTIVVTCHCHKKICDTFSSLFLILREGVSQQLRDTVSQSVTKCHKLVPLIPCQNAVKASTLVDEFRPAMQSLTDGLLVDSRQDLVDVLERFLAVS